MTKLRHHLFMKWHFLESGIWFVDVQILSIYKIPSPVRFEIQSTYYGDKLKNFLVSKWLIEQHQIFLNSLIIKKGNPISYLETAFLLKFNIFTTLSPNDIKQFSELHKIWSTKWPFYKRVECKFFEFYKKNLA